MKKKNQDVEDGLRHLIKSENENIYLFISESGKHEVTIPDENRRENEKERRHMDAIMRRLSELHGHFDMEA
jgi:hypothetical protein